MADVYAGDVVEALERRYNPPGKPRQFATFTEVTDAQQRRRIDFLAVNLWQSRGRIVEGVEIKVRRPDWLKELSQPKADAWFGIVNRWWIAAPPGVLQRSELPDTWGFLEARKHGKTGTLTAFPEVTPPDLKPPVEWPPWLVQRLLTRGEDRRKALPQEIADARSEGYTEGYERGRSHGRGEAGAMAESQRQLTELLQALGGEDISYRPSQQRLELVRRAVRLADTGRLPMMARNAAKEFRLAATHIEEVLAEAEREPPTTG